LSEDWYKLGSIGASIADDSRGGMLLFPFPAQPPRSSGSETTMANIHFISPNNITGPMWNRQTGGQGN
jgi:hypothetical protein